MNITKGMIAGAAILTAVAVFVGAQGADKQAYHWSNAELVKMWPEITAQAKAAKIGTGAKTIVVSPTHSVYVVTKDKTYPELHDFDNDVFVVKEGGGTFQIGGELIDKKAMGNGNASGTSIKGGEMKKVGPGDVIYVPKGMPHVWHFAEGQTVSYIAIKITEK